MQQPPLAFLNIDGILHVLFKLNTFGFTPCVLSQHKWKCLNYFFCVQRNCITYGPDYGVYLMQKQTIHIKMFFARTFQLCNLLLCDSYPTEEGDTIM